ncbi:Sec-independent protein translocase protein TatB [Jannaschia donghaensis]|uniref:Sec-independent protein translocase protein TatB n=1 Tax=Jannaschia donghaensis TaxID=420998 RepID=A0A0M6YM36_9RHOB|nr:Sec-independent protein translocase protein TatB [Jannaschia donghaensis]CTQ50964.1 Sec-independent protein translocase protein TatB [Jannaschia donghaensis]
MFDIGMSEMLVVGVVALIVVGPKDLPRMFRTLGEFTGKARKMAREFQTAMNDAANDSGVNDIAGDLRKMADPKQYGMDKIKEATSELSAWSPDGPDAKPAPKTGDAARAAEAAELSGEPELLPDPGAPEPDPKPAKTDESA